MKRTDFEDDLKIMQIAFSGANISPPYYRR
jgi:hypothetical protein